jgi:hypothetical protein
MEFSGHLFSWNDIILILSRVSTPSQQYGGTRRIIKKKFANFNSALPCSALAKAMNKETAKEKAFNKLAKT